MLETTPRLHQIPALTIRRFFAYASGMGGERASTTRRRRAGKICCNCESILPASDRPGERYCARCEAERAPRRRVYMNFMLRDGWRSSFLEEDLKTPLPRKVYSGRLRRCSHSPSGAGV